MDSIMVSIMDSIMVSFTVTFTITIKPPNGESGKSNIRRSMLTPLQPHTTSQHLVLNPLRGERYIKIAQPRQKSKGEARSQGEASAMGEAQGAGGWACAPSPATPSGGGSVALGLGRGSAAAKGCASCPFGGLMGRKCSGQLRRLASGRAARSVGSVFQSLNLRRNARGAVAGFGLGYRVQAPTLRGAGGG